MQSRYLQSTTTKKNPIWRAALLLGSFSGRLLMRLGSLLLLGVRRAHAGHRCVTALLRQGHNPTLLDLGRISARDLVWPA